MHAVTTTTILAEGKEDPTLRHSGFRNWSSKPSDLQLLLFFIIIFICIFFVLCQITFFAISFCVDNTFTPHAVCWAILARIQLPNKKLYIHVRKKMKIIKLMLTEHNNVMFKKTKWFPCTWHSVALEALSSLALVFLHWPEETRLCPLSFNLWFMFLYTCIPFLYTHTSFVFNLAKPSDKPPVIDRRFDNK